MKLVKKRIRWILLVGLLILSLCVPLTHVHAVEEPAASSQSALIMDADNGQVLYSRNAQNRYPVASMSKLMTIAVIEHEISQKKLKWSDKIRVSSEEARISEDHSLSNIPLKAGRQYSVRQLVEMSLVKSADGATITLSRAEGDNTAQFVQKMNQMAKQIGLSDYRFYNPVGLNNSDMGSLKLPGVADSAENEMTANDVAKLSRYLIKHYPGLLKISRMSQLTVDGVQYQNLNTMLPGKANAPKKVQIDGLKTGTSDRAGQCFVSSGLYQGRRIITVVMHSDNRFAETKQLYSYLASHYQLQDFKSTTTVKTSGSKQTSITLAPQHGQKIWLPIGTKVTGNLQKPNGQSLQSLPAPLTKQQYVGRLVFKQLPMLDGQSYTVKLYSQETLYRRGLLGIWDHLTKF